MSGMISASVRASQTKPTTTAWSPSISRPACQESNKSWSSGSGNRSNSEGVCERETGLRTRGASST